jgi:NAD(P)-dependent dehydrogenase (short-subunit alcohol dehydrogenase family)
VLDHRGIVVVVTGATGNQGGATARHLLAAGWRVRALAAGAELVRGNLDTDPVSLRKVQPGLMNFGTWLKRSGKARLLMQLGSMSAWLARGGAESTGGSG